MPITSKKKRTPQASHRLSVSLTEEQYAELIEIAEKNRVSVAWVIRGAIERLLRDEQLLFHARHEP